MTQQPSVLVVDDDQHPRHRIRCAKSTRSPPPRVEGGDGADPLGEHSIALTDVRMPQVSGSTFVAGGSRIPRRPSSS
jgi:FixJ family two-component response regulator